MKNDINFFDLFLAAVQERKLTIKDLEEANVLHKNVFYGFKNDCPSLKNAIQIANFLEVSIDYILENTDENLFSKYKFPQNNFYDNLTEILREMNVSKAALAREAGFAETNYIYWKRGSQPKLSTLIEISRVLNCKIDDLLEREK